MWQENKAETCNNANGSNIQNLRVIGLRPKKIPLILHWERFVHQVLLRPWDLSRNREKEKNIRELSVCKLWLPRRFFGLLENLGGLG